MTTGDEMAKTLCKLLAQIAEREKVKSIQKDDYDDAFIAAVVEGLFREAENSLE